METRETSFRETQISEENSPLVAKKLDVLLKVDIKHSALIHFLKTLRRSSFLNDVQLVSSKSIGLKCKTEYFDKKRKRFNFTKKFFPFQLLGIQNTYLNLIYVTIWWLSLSLNLIWIILDGMTRIIENEENISPNYHSIFDSKYKTTNTWLAGKNELSTN